MQEYLLKLTVTYGLKKQNYIYKIYIHAIYKPNQTHTYLYMFIVHPISQIEYWRQRKKYLTMLIAIISNKLFKCNIRFKFMLHKEETNQTKK